MQKRTLEIAGITVSDSSKCFVIAEIGHNHQGKVSLAKEMINLHSAFSRQEAYKTFMKTHAKLIAS